jgi:hypothetical protein
MCQFFHLFIWVIFFCQTPTIFSALDDQENKNCINCQNSTNCTNVVNCTNCRNVRDSINVFNSENVYKSSNISFSSFITNSTNVTDSQNCDNCKNCKNCIQCNDCIGYNCRNENGCRNSKWKFKYWEPDEKDEKAWKCSNPLFNDLNFNVAGYKKPTFLINAEISKDLDYCYPFEGNRLDFYLAYLFYKALLFYLDLVVIVQQLEKYVRLLSIIRKHYN